MGDAATQRSAFWVHYSSVSSHLWTWLSALPEEYRHLYAPYVLPRVSDTREMARLSGITATNRDGQEKRKAETDALMPFYMDLRAQVHFRYNLLRRLRRAYQDAIRIVQDGRATLPLTFELREGGAPSPDRPPTERLMFRLWDRRSFVLAHLHAYGGQTVQHARARTHAYAPEKKAFYLEFRGIEPLGDVHPVTGLWFYELLEQDVLGRNAAYGAPEQVAAKQEWLKAQGYGENLDDETATAPFHGMSPGLLAWQLYSGDGRFADVARAVTGTIFIPVDPLYRAAVFGMVALHIITANGMRVGELMQLRLTPDCLRGMRIPPAPDAEDQTARIHWQARVLPKGYRAPVPFYFDDEHMRLLALVKAMLLEHYGTDPASGGPLPVVAFRGDYERNHRFEPDQYLFQFGGVSLRTTAIRACMRFITHGLVFQTADSRRVIVRPHLLRHGFATWAINVAKEPIDLVGAILNQKNLDVTAYYGRPTSAMIVRASRGLMDQISSVIDLAAAIVRSPEELRRLVHEARCTHGTLVKVRGGTCLCGGECPLLFACVGCAAKAPDPAQRREVEEARQVALIQVQNARQKGLTLEALQHEKKVRDAETELREMDLIEAYRADEARELEVYFHD